MPYSLVNGTDVSEKPTVSVFSVKDSADSHP